jgi:hypothetical protein
MYVCVCVRCDDWLSRGDGGGSAWGVRREGLARARSACILSRKASLQGVADEAARQGGGQRWVGEGGGGRGRLEEDDCRGGPRRTTTSGV